MLTSTTFIRLFVLPFFLMMACCAPVRASLFGAESLLQEPSKALPKSAPLKARATTDVSDIWWNPAESGWGMQLVQNNATVFATLFVYGSDGKPTWYAATMNLTGGFTWSGALFATTGPWFAEVPFDSTQFKVRQVGNITFHATDIANGTLTYTVDGSTVSKAIRRQTLVNEVIAGAYDLVVYKHQVCVPALGGTGTLSVRALFTLTQIGNNVVGVSGSCTFNGTSSQSGKMMNVTGTYSCATTGETGSFSMFEIVVTETGLMLRMSEQSNLCSSISVEAAGIRQ